MGIDITYFKGSPSGTPIQVTGHLEPGPTEVIIKIAYCGVCGSDEHYLHKDQGLGHEGVGTIIEVGSLVHEVSDLKMGDRVGTSWYQKYCGRCKACLSGRQNHCSTGSWYGQGYLSQGCFGTAVAWDVSAVTKIPDEIALEDAAPLMCAGCTVWHAIEKSGVRAGGCVGVIGVGGLGHMAIQFLSKMGIDAVAFSRTADKKEETMELGAAEFYGTHEVAELKSRGVKKLDALLITSSYTPDISPYFTILAVGAKIFPLTFTAELLHVTPFIINTLGAEVIGTGLCPVQSIRDMLAFSAKHGIKPLIEMFPMTQIGVIEALQKRRDGTVRYRGVLVAPEIKLQEQIDM